VVFPQWTMKLVPLWQPLTLVCCECLLKGPSGTISSTPETPHSPPGSCCEAVWVPLLPLPRTVLLFFAGPWCSLITGFCCSCPLCVPAVVTRYAEIPACPQDAIPAILVQPSIPILKSKIQNALKSQTLSSHSIQWLWILGHFLLWSFWLGMLHW
jgi:hypothetical protein